MDGRFAGLGEFETSASAIEVGGLRHAVVAFDWLDEAFFYYPIHHVFFHLWELLLSLLFGTGDAAFVVLNLEGLYVECLHQRVAHDFPMARYGDLGCDFPSEAVVAPFLGMEVGEGVVFAEGVFRLVVFAGQHGVPDAREVGLLGAAYDHQALVAELFQLLLGDTHQELVLLVDVDVLHQIVIQAHPFAAPSDVVLYAGRLEQTTAGGQNGFVAFHVVRLHDETVFFLLAYRFLEEDALFPLSFHGGAGVVEVLHVAEELLVA